jgi:asparagine synthetase B (glutamine-hydrolysing)
MIDKILETVVNREVQDKEVAVLLSGGVDSLSVACAAHRLGKKVSAYTFHLEGDPTYDANKAEEAAKVFGWDFDLTIVPTDKLVEDFKTLVSKYDCRLKTQFENTFAYMYMFPKIKEKYIMMGMGVDHWYGSSKKCAMHFKEPKELFDQYRKEYFDDPAPANLMTLRTLTEEYDKSLVLPYLWHKEIEDFFWPMSWNDLNKGKKNKFLIREAFKEEFSKIEPIKVHLNMQLGANIDDLFEKLIDNKEINFKNRVRVMDICRDWYTLNQSNASLEHLF